MFQLIEFYLENQSFSSLCHRFLTHFTNSEVLHFLKSLYDLLKEKIDHPTIIFRLLSFHWTDLSQLFVINAFLSHPCDSLTLYSELQSNLSLLESNKKKIENILLDSSSSSSSLCKFTFSNSKFSLFKTSACETKWILDYLQSEISTVTDEFQLQSLCVFVCFLLHDIKKSNSQLCLISSILNLFGIEQKPVYYELLDQPKSKKRRKNLKSKNLSPSNRGDDSSNVQSGWILPSLFYRDEKIQFSPFDISSYIATHYILKFLISFRKLK